MILSRALGLFLALASASMSVSVSAEEDTCGLYLAVSSTSTLEEPKWGLFAGKEYPKDMPIGAGEVAIHTFHLMANSLWEGVEETDLSTVVEFFEQFIWVPQSSGGQYELADGGRIVTAIPGPGVLGGYNGKLTNSDWNHTSAYHREAWNEEPEVAHPGRGAYSNYYNVALRTTQKIPPGMEIFVNYGENWEDGDDEEDNLITREDYEKIDETVNKMIEFFGKHADELDEKSKEEIYNFLIRDVMSAAAGSRKGAKIASMLPETADKLHEVVAAGGSLQLAQPSAVRSLEWLEKNGLCMDNIRPGPSTIPHAGRGAIASRDIKAGSLVAPVPLVQIADENILNMHQMKKLFDENDEEYFVRADDDVIGSQLLANYCWGHPESTLQFFPAGSSVALINHSKEPNAKMVWSNHANNHKHWFDLEPFELIESSNQHLGLLMEIVATKDIAEGDEVLIDYGDAWAAAWDDHVKEWEELVTKGELSNPWPKRALDLNQEHKSKPFEPKAEYPQNVVLKCFLMVSKPTNEPPVNENGDKIRLWVEEEHQSTIVADNLFNCKVESKEETTSGWTYTVSWASKTEKTFVKNVPHRAITFVDKPGMSDQHTPHSFRHYIGIPDDIFPQGPWRNVN